VASFGHGFGHRRRTPADPRLLVETPADSPEVVVPSHRPIVPTVEDDEENGGTVVDRPKPRPDTPEGRREQVLAALLTDLAMGRTFPKQRALCETYNVPRSTMSNWLIAWQEDGVIPARQKIGRCKVLQTA
jgi:hypothetical protein